ncbi:MAG: hypothetical protein I3273_02605 [Candidatus Moeniiplasma glomeromycotorum]|nr:hypothetical protein [Candidatus Moeniiplasma glomeromycotorum]MCE8167653.1 hypothetical protein [Candidatus Moeniiplasma glomeromycotorum]MCE8168996.1 hypothetical protein [Candidatus Moeniiplasma glomeromycotorum]
MNIVYQPLKEKGQEPEYQKSPSLPISSIGTENTKKITGQLPYGSVLLTDTGDSSPLKDKGITHIAHAAMMPLNSDRSNETKFRVVAALCIQNAVFLAEKHGHEKLATCFLGGKIYCSVEEAKPPLAVAIILAGLGQLEGCSKMKKIYFVDFDGNYFKDAKETIEKGMAGMAKVKNLNRIEVVNGDLCKQKGSLVHDATIIVNSENAQMGWGDGISGAIGNALGAEKSRIGAEREKLRDEFNDLIQEEDNNGRDTQYTCPQCKNEYNTKSKPLVEGKYCSQTCREAAESSEKKTCAFCSKNFVASSGIIYNNKDYCSNECSLKQQEKDLPSKPNGILTQIRSQVISTIQQALNLDPKINNSDLLSDYQDWEKIIQQTSSESEINQFKEKVLSDIKNQRKIKRESAARDQKINQAHTAEEKVKLLKEMGSSLGELTPEQEAKLEQVKDDLSINLSQLRDAIQKEIICHLTASGVQAENLDPATKNQWKSLKNETDSVKIRVIEKQLIQAIGEKGVGLKITSLTQQVDTILKNKQKTKIQEAKNKLLELISSPNRFIQTKKSQFQALLQKLEQGVQNQNNTLSSSKKPELPWKVVVPILLAIVGGIIISAILIRKKTNGNPTSA